MFSSALGDLPEIAECLGRGFLCEFFLPVPQIFCEVLSIKVTVSCNAGVVFGCPPLRVAEWYGPGQNCRGGADI